MSDEATPPSSLLGDLGRIAAAQERVANALEQLNAQVGVVAEDIDRIATALERAFPPPLPIVGIVPVPGVPVLRKT